MHAFDLFILFRARHYRLPMRASLPAYHKILGSTSARHAKAEAEKVSVNKVPVAKPDYHLLSYRNFSAPRYLGL